MDVYVIYGIDDFDETDIIAVVDNEEVAKQFLVDNRYTKIGGLDVDYHYEKLTLNYSDRFNLPLV